MKRLPPEELEDQHVLQVYDEIAKHFSHTRNRAWKEVRDYLLALPKYSFVLDLGCGNGVNLRANKMLIDVGSDVSFKFCEIAHLKKKRQIFCANALKVPVRDQSFDHLICIAVIHHFASEERRINCLSEIARIIKVGGTALITAWATEQHNRKYDEPDQMVSWTVDRRFGEAGKKLDRFYHLFTKGEFAELCKGVEALELTSERLENDNWIATFKRIK